MKFKALLFLFLLVSCGSVQDEGSFLSPIGEEEWLRRPEMVGPSYQILSTDPVIWEGAREWNKALGQDVFQTEPGFATVEIQVLVQDELQAVCDMSYSCTIVDIESHTATVFVPIIWSKELARHELGHVLGFGHSRNPYSVMFHLWTSEQQITPELVDLFLSHLAKGKML